MAMYDPIFEKTQVSSFDVGRGYVSEECSDTILDGVGNCWDFNFELRNFHDRKTDKVSDDIADMLPSDPFGMDISATFTAISSWIEEFENDFELSALGFVMDESEGKTRDDRIFAGVNFVWNGAMKFYQGVSNVNTDENSLEFVINDEYDNSLLLDGSDVCGNSGICGNSIGEYRGCTKDSFNGAEAGAPHDALFFALGHLGVKDLLSVERVCKSLRHAVQNDPLLWRSIQISWPLSDKIGDDTLLYLTDRAQGRLQSLSLVRCRKITNSGLKCVLQNNPRLEKLGVPGCSRLSIEGIVSNLKFLKTAGSPGIKSLRIAGIFGPTMNHFEELMSLFDMDNHHKVSTAYKPWFYGGEHPYLSIDDDRPIDIEACPRCLHFRQVYDCPSDACQGKNRAPCRACIVCIGRCYSCGCCIKSRDFVENFNLDYICMPCWQQFGCDNQAETPPLNHHIFHEQADLNQSWQLPICHSWIFFN